MEIKAVGTFVLMFLHQLLSDYEPSPLPASSMLAFENTIQADIKWFGKLLVFVHELKVRGLLRECSLLKTVFALRQFSIHCTL